MSEMEAAGLSKTTPKKKAIKKAPHKHSVTIDEVISSPSVDERKQYYAIEYYYGYVHVYEYTGPDGYRATAESKGTRLIVGPFSAVDLTEAENIGCSLLTSIDDTGFTLLEESFYRYCRNSINMYDTLETSHYIFFMLEKTHHNYDDDARALRLNYSHHHALVCNKNQNTLGYRKFIMKMQKLHP